MRILHTLFASIIIGLPSILWNVSIGNFVILTCQYMVCYSIIITASFILLLRLFGFCCKYYTNKLLGVVLVSAPALYGYGRGGSIGGAQGARAPPNPK